MGGNIRSLKEAILEWEGRDLSGARVSTSTVAVHRSRVTSICWKKENLAKTRILWVTDRTTKVCKGLFRLVGSDRVDSIDGLCPRDT